MCSIESSLLLDPPEPHSPENILNKLNDNCLHVIFSTTNLDVWDLVEIAGVCRIFNSIATDVFKAKHTHFDGHQGETIKSDWPFEQLLETFGSSIESFGTIALNDEECGQVAEYCPNIKELKCRILEQETIDDYRDLFVRLKRLTICFRNGSPNMTDWFGVDIQWESFTLHHYSYNVRLPLGNLPKLREFDFNVSVLHGNEVFFRENPQLEHISMSACYNYGSSIDYSFFSSLPNLRTLDLTKVKNLY